MTETILEPSEGWTPRMVEWACVMVIRGTPEYQRGWEFGLALGDDVDKAVNMEPFWAGDHEWGDPAANYRTMAMLIKKTIEYNREAKGMGEYTLAADLGRWEGYNRNLQLQRMDHEIKPVPKKMKMKRRYACPVPCDAKCVVEMTTEHIQVHIFCPCGCGWVQGWILLDEEAGGEQ